MADNDKPQLDHPEEMLDHPEEMLGPLEEFRDPQTQRAMRDLGRQYGMQEAARPQAALDYNQWRELARLERELWKAGYPREEIHIRVEQRKLDMYQNQQLLEELWEHQIRLQGPPQWNQMAQDAALYGNGMAFVEEGAQIIQNPQQGVDWGRWEPIREDAPPEIKELILDTEDLDEEGHMKKIEVKTMRDARARNYEIFPDKNDEKRGVKEAAIKYIEHLGNEAGVDVSEFKLDKFKKSGKIVTNRVQINKIFFGLAKKSLALDRPQYVKADAIKAVAGRLNCDPLAAVTEAETLLRRAEVSLLENKRYLVESEQLIEKRKAELAKAEQLAKGTPRFELSSVLRKIMKKGIFTLCDKQPDVGIHFLSRPIRKTFFSKEQATNLVVPFGQFVVHVFSGTIYGGAPWDCRVKAGLDNIVTQGYLHPHVQGRGDKGGVKICFGSAGKAYDNARTKGDLEGMLDAIWDVFQNFEDRSGDGYRPLHEFEATYRELNKLKQEAAKNVKKTKTAEKEQQDPNWA